MGVSNALKSLGLEAKHEIGCDILADSLKVYNANFQPNKSILENADNLFRVIKYKEIEGIKIPVISR